MSHPENRFDNPKVAGEVRDLALAAWHARRTRDVSGATAPPKESAAEFAAWWKIHAPRMSSLRHAVWQSWMAAVPDTKETPVQKSRRLFEAWWQLTMEPAPTDEDSEADEDGGEDSSDDTELAADSGDASLAGKRITPSRGKA